MTKDKKSFVNIEAIPKELLTNLLGPATVGIGQGLGGVVNFIMNPLRKLNVITEKNYKDFVEKINVETNKIPEDNRDSSKLGIALKIMEDARYQLDEEDMREYFSRLVAGTIDNRKNSKISPRFSSILSELTTTDANLLKLIHNNNSVRRAALARVRIFNKETKIWRDIESKIILTPDKITYQPTSFETLVSFGLIDYNETEAASSKIFRDVYDSFKESEYYNNLKERAVEITKKSTAYPPSKTSIQYAKGSVILTQSGKDFCSLIFPSELKKTA